MSVKIFNLSLPKELVFLIDRQAKLRYSTRSEYIKHAIITRLKSEDAFEVAVSPPTLEELKSRQLKDFLESYTSNKSDSE
jgi:Arc/MetJ-type ribon-helix-helix transcriptional regulator